MRKSFSVVCTVCLVFVQSVRADEQAELKAVVDKAVKALGGSEALNKFRAFTAKTKGTFFDPVEMPFTQDAQSVFPAQHRFDMNIDINGTKLTQLLVINGDKGWIHANNTTADMPKDMHAAFRDYTHALSLAMTPGLLSDKAFKLTSLGEVKVGERAAIGIQVSQKDRPDVSLYFDKENGLPLKCETRAKTLETGMEVSHEFLFSDYKETDGLKTYTKLTWKRDGKRYLEMEMTEIKPQEKLDETLFGKP
jgi:hypothetical protein